MQDIHARRRILRFAQAETVLFSPPSCIAQAIERQLAGATRTIDIAMYELSLPQLAEQLPPAAKRGVAVRIVLDASNVPLAKNFLAAWKAAGIPVRSDAVEKIMHEKMAIIDGETVVTGSYNWTFPAEKENAELALITDDPATVAACQAEFCKHWNHGTQL